MISIVLKPLSSKSANPTALIDLNVKALSPTDLIIPLLNIGLKAQNAQVVCNILLPNLAAPVDPTAPIALIFRVTNLPDLLLQPHLLLSTVQDALCLKNVHLTALIALNAQALSLTVPLAHLLILRLSDLTPLK